MSEIELQKNFPNVEKLRLLDVYEIKCSKNGKILVVLNEMDEDGRRLAITMSYEELSKALDNSGM